MQTSYLLLADAVLALHALIVFFNIGALPLIWLGYFKGWDFVRNFYFRVGHLCLLAYVTGEAVLGAVCPLTFWEDALRIRAGAEPRYAGHWLAHWLHELIYYDVEPRVFAVGYAAFLLLVFFTFIRVKPNLPGRARNPKSEIRNPKQIRKD